MKPGDERPGKAENKGRIPLSHPRSGKGPPGGGGSPKGGGVIAPRRGGENAPPERGASHHAPFPGRAWLGARGPKEGPGRNGRARADQTAPAPGSPPFLSEHSERTTARVQGGGARQGGKGGRPGEGEGREGADKPCKPNRPEGDEGPQKGPLRRPGRQPRGEAARPNQAGRGRRGKKRPPGDDGQHKKQE